MYQQPKENMFLPGVAIERNTLIHDIVKQNHRSADVFRKYGIEYCCGGRWPIETVCIAKGLDYEEIKSELLNTCNTIQLPSSLPYEEWPIDFLINYIIHIHHYYLKTSLPETEVIFRNFTEGHSQKFPHLEDAFELFIQLKKELLPHIEQEEETIFPYIRQVANAHKNNDTFAKLLVKTLRKPIEALAAHEHKFVNSSIFRLRQLTNNYVPPDNACTSHKISLARLKELDKDLVQHIYLENNILFPKALRMEQDLLR